MKWWCDAVENTSPRHCSCLIAFVVCFFFVSPFSIKSQIQVFFCFNSGGRMNLPFVHEKKWIKRQFTMLLMFFPFLSLTYLKNETVSSIASICFKDVEISVHFQVMSTVRWSKCIFYLILFFNIVDMELQDLN